MMWVSRVIRVRYRRDADNPQAPLGMDDRRRCPGLPTWSGVVGLCACIALLGGCGSTAGIVKETLKDPPNLANAFSRALSFDKIRKKQKPTAEPPAASGYASVPIEEDGPRVRRFVRLYAYDQRETMKKYLARAKRYFPMVKAMTAENGLPEDLAYLFLLESGANPEARSPANALGMWQFMADTARSYGMRVDSWVDERLDPEKSTKAALLYLKDLYGMFGCWRLALSAYNSGENKLNKVLCQEDADEYDEICSSKRLKRETKEFYPRFQAIAHIAKNAGKYGFSPLNSKSSETKYEFVPVEGSYSLAVLADAVGASPAILADLNPALVRDMTPPQGPPYPLRVPLGKREILLAKIEDMTPTQTEERTVHVVHRGDNVWKICKRYGINKQQLAELNPDINLRRRLRQGLKVVVPTHKARTKATVRKPDRLSRL